MLLKKSSLRRLLLRLLSLRRYLSSIYMYIAAWIGKWVYNTTGICTSGRVMVNERN